MLRHIHYNTCFAVTAHWALLGGVGGDGWGVATKFTGVQNESLSLYKRNIYVHEQGQLTNNSSIIGQDNTSHQIRSKFQIIPECTVPFCFFLIGMLVCMWLVPSAKSRQADVVRNNGNSIIIYLFFITDITLKFLVVVGFSSEPPFSIRR